MIFCLILLLVPALTVQAQGLTEEEGPFEGGDIDITLEFKSNGRLKFDITAQGETSAETGGFGEDTSIESAEGSFQIDSPSSGQLELDAEASMTFYEGYLTPQQEASFGMIDKDFINEGFPGEFEGLNSFEGEQLSSILSQGEGTFGGELPGGVSEGGIPPEISDLTIEELSCTEFSWDKPQVSASFTATLSGTIFENEKLQEWLPIDTEFSMEISETSMSLTFKVDSSKGELDLNFSSTISDTTQTTEATLEGYVELPQENGNVKWDMGSSQVQNPLTQNYFQDLENQFGQNNVSVTVKVPSDAEVLGLPSDAQEEDGEYTWAGEDAASALSSMSTGQTETEVTYEYEPSGGGLLYMWIGVGIAIVVVLAAIGVAVRR